MNRIHGAPAQALRNALAALSDLAFWIAWTADPDLPPEPAIGARAMRHTAASLRKAARLLDEAADREDLPSGGDAGTGRRHPATGSDAVRTRPGEAEPGSGVGGRGPG